ncbi:MAG: T9SS type A sorting domain-containing protein [Lewinellaceae bacterium]|nr:T9SS type A sorting domain-containing protein [Lewinellaceae bacterium]
MDNLIYRSTDDGQTWESIAPPGQYTYDVWAFDDKLYVEWYNQYWRLAANGVDWELVSPDFGTQEYASNMFATGPHLMFATEHYLWGSNDGGVTWKKTAIPYHNTPGKFVQVGNRIYKDAGNTGLMYTEDFGYTWAEVPIPDYHGILDLATAGGYLLGASYNQGVFRLDETANLLVPANDGLYSAAVYFLEANATDLWAACGNGVFAYDLAAQSWKNTALLPLPGNYFSKVASSASGKIAAVPVYADYFYLSTDNGLSWDKISPYQAVGGWGSIRNLFWLDDALVVKGDFSSNLRSVDLGKTWAITGITPDQIVYFKGKHYGTPIIASSLYSSSNLGQSWEAVPAPAGVLFLKLAATDDRLFAEGVKSGNQRMLYYSTDGIQWTYASDGLPDADLFPSDIDLYLGNIWQKNGTYYYYDPQIGLFASLDDCQTWLPIQYLPYNNLALVDTTFYMGGFGGGVVKIGLPQQYGALSSGFVFKDDNNDGLFNPGETPLPAVQVHVHEPTAWHPFWMTTSKDDGSYAIGSTPGSMDTLRVKVNSPYVDQINPPFHLVSGSGTDRNFGVHFSADILDVSLAGKFAGRPRPGFNLNTHLQITNDGTLPANGTVSLKLDPNFQFIAADPAPSAVIGGDSLIWDFTQLLLFEKRVISVSGNLAPTVPLGSLLKMYAHVEPNAPDATPQNNHLVLCDTVVGSFDPNDKLVDPPLGLTAAEIADGKELHYTIRFQNTGTAPASLVRITDLIDTALQVTTLRLVSSSHPVSDFRLLPGRLLEILFDPIDLPDSLSDEAGSHGFVTFAIQRNKAYRSNYFVQNKAAIYFDYNEPVITNIVKSGIITISVSTDEPGEQQHAGNTLRIVPNPAPSGFTVYTTGDRLNGPGMLEISNLAGQRCYRQPVADLSTPVSVPEVRLPDGVYVVKIAGAAGVLAGKLVVQR